MIRSGTLARNCYTLVTQLTLYIHIMSTVSQDTES